MLNLFESLIHPYPDEAPEVPPKTLLAFIYGKRSTLPSCQPNYTVATVLSGNNSSIRL